MSALMWITTRRSKRQIATAAVLVTVALAAPVLTCAASPAEPSIEPGLAEIGVVEATGTGAAPAYLLARGAGYGSQGGSATVRGLQQLLYRRGYEPGPIDGLYGPLTQSAVERFQRAQGLVVDGVVGPQTRGRLISPPLEQSHARGSPVVRRGAGYGTLGRSERVAELQRMLRGLGYEPGPVDGLFGPRTRAAVHSFQASHGVRPSGSVDGATLSRLRVLAGSTGGEPRGQPANAAGPGSRLGGRLVASRPGRAQPGDGQNHGRAVSPLLVALLLALAATAVTLLSKGLSRRERGESARPERGADGGTPPTADRPSPAPAQEPPRVLGYAKGHRKADLERQATTLERACRERGWTLAHVVRDHGSPEPNTLERPGLTYALKQLREGVAARLVVDKLEHLGRSPADLGPLLRWCATNGVDLVALDVGLDTTTHEGRLAAGYLLAIGKRQKETRRPRAPRRKRPQPMAGRH
jgi:peptidoglycan hydrolase-like protein with peptidoglycan-binding domain